MTTSRARALTWGWGRAKETGWGLPWGLASGWATYAKRRGRISHSQPAALEAPRVVACTDL